MLGYSHVGAGGDDVIVRCLLGEVFERGQRERTFLYLVKEEQCSAGEYPLIGGEFELTDYSLRVKILLEYPG